MPNRSLDEINRELVAKQQELDEALAESGFSETLDNIDADLGEVTEFIDKTSTGIGEAGENIGENFEELTEAVEGMKELIGDDEFNQAVDEALAETGGAVENVQGGLESTTNVLGQVNDGLGKLEKALEAIQRIDDLRTADGAEALEALADSFEFVVEELGPFVDKVPGLGAFFRVYAAGIRNIANSARAIEDRVNELNSIYRDPITGRAEPGSSLYMTPEWFADQRVSRLQGEYDQLLDEAMESAGAELDARSAPPTGSSFDPIDHVVRSAWDKCSGLAPNSNGDAFKKWRRAKIARDAARLGRSEAYGAVLTIQYTGEGDLGRAEDLLEAADNRLATTEAAFERDGADYEAERQAYDDCVKRRIVEFSGYEGLSAGQLRVLGIEYPQWDISGWEPVSAGPGVVIGGATAAAAMGRSGSPRFATAMVIMGGLFVAAGLTGLIAVFADQPVLVGTLGDIAQPIGTESAGTPPSSSGAELTPWVPSPNPLPATIEIADPTPVETSDPMTPTVIDFCSGIRHGTSMSEIFYDVRIAYVPPGARIGLTSYGPPGATTPFFGETSLDDSGYGRVMYDIFQFGSYTPQTLTIDVDGDVTNLAGSVVGDTVEVGSAERDCNPADLSPLPPPQEIDDTVRTVAATPGGGAVAIPSTDPAASESTVVTAGSPQLAPAVAGAEATDPDGMGTAERAIALGLVASAAAGLATATGPGPGLSGSGTRPGPQTYTAEDREFLQEIYVGAQEAGVNIVGLSRVDSIEDALAGSRANPVNIGKSATLYVRVGPDGSMLPPRGFSDTAATSILKIDVRPGVEFDSDGNAHVVWNSHVTQIDTRTAKIIESSSSGPSSEEWEAAVGDRSRVEAGNDPELSDWLVESMPSTPGEAVRQALSGAGVSN